MSSIEVVDVNPALAVGPRRELDVRLMQVLDSLDRTRGYRQRWRVVTGAVRPAPTPTQESHGSTVTAGQPTPLDFAAWHAHLAGRRRWAARRVLEGIGGR